MAKLFFLQRLIASFSEAFGFSSEPPFCFYLEGCPFLEEPYRMFTPDLGNVCLLNGVTFHVDPDLGYRTLIEDRPGLIAAVRTATTRNGEKANLQAITRWRLYCADGNER
jgi:hypothetical protein